MTGTFLLTFDSEGKWGIVDCLTPRDRRCYTSQRLEAAYGEVLSLLQKYRIGATFAFTAAFSMSRSEFGQLRPDIDSCGATGAPWMSQALREIEKDDGDGWFAPSCFQAVKEARTHEIGSHGFSHVPWGAPYATRKLLDAELSLNRKVAGFDAESVQTFVYPRNQVAHKDLLPLHGFHTFRGARRSFGRPANLMREFNLFSTSEQFDPTERLPLAMPAGHFLNWRRGLRRCVPMSLTVARWEHMLRHAARTGGVVHAWTHPENFVDADSMFSLLEKVLRFVADEREAGRMRVVTCSELVRLSPASQQVNPTVRHAPEESALIRGK
jgi:peptidoglycan/xylan/chitin deacetylase (PgdA/CDA1 family)